MLRELYVKTRGTPPDTTVRVFFFAEEAMTRLKPGEPYAGRRPDAEAINLTVDREAAAILRACSGPSGKRMGAFVGRLLYEHQAREEERQRIAQQMQAVLAG
jgi:hypothetical protein